MKTILKPVLTAILAISSLFWATGGVAQTSTGSSDDSRPVLKVPDPATSQPSATQPAPAQPVTTGQQPAPADATQPAVSDSDQKATDKDVYKHDGGKDDVDAIGNRKGVGGRGMGNWYSYEKEIAMGKEFAQRKAPEGPVPVPAKLTELVVAPGDPSTATRQWEK